MSYEILRLTRNILLRSFAISIVIVIILAVATFAGWETWMNTARNWLHVDEATLARLMLEFFLNVRFFLLFIVLAPALAIHWTLKKERP